jgi:hypothetical protein
VRDGSENPLCFNLNLFQVLKKHKLQRTADQSGEEERQSQLQGHAQIPLLAEIYKKSATLDLHHKVYQTTVLWVVDVS